MTPPSLSTFAEWTMKLFFDSIFFKKMYLIFILCSVYVCVPLCFYDHLLLAWCPWRPEGELGTLYLSY